MNHDDLIYLIGVKQIQIEILTKQIIELKEATKKEMKAFPEPKEKGAE
jgi:hypothetical protein